MSARSREAKDTAPEGPRPSPSASEEPVRTATTHEAIRAELARLRDAGRTLRSQPAVRRLDALAAVLDAWRAPDSPWAEALVATLPEPSGFAPETIREGLRRALEPLSGAALHDLVTRELGGAAVLDGRGATLAGGFETTAVVLAGALPTPTLVALLAPLIVGSPVLAKPAAHDPVTAALVARSLAAVDSRLGDAVALAPFPRDDAACTEALLEADCVVTTGSDATVASLAARVAPPRRFVGYGHRLSVAAFGPEATRGPALERAAAGLAADVALWDQQGCLSPVALYVVDGDARAPDRVAEALAHALASAAPRWPRGRIGTAAAEAVTRERAEAEMRAAAGRPVAVYACERLSYSVVREEDARPRPAPLHRFVRVHPVADAESLAAALYPLAPHLAGVACAGFGPATSVVARLLAALGASRVCAPGALQAPPLGWHHDGRGVLLPLVRWTDVELA